MAVDVAQFIDIDNGLLRGEIYTNEEIYQQELAQIFARSWVFIGHDSMLKKPGDFLQMYIGEDPIVVTRLKDGSISAWMNQCRHRGMRICRADRGTAKTFMCSFHGWTYDLDGKLINVPHEATSYSPEVFDKNDWGPRHLAQIHNYKGFIFGTWDPTAPPFEEYLGDMAWYFDAHIDRFAGGMEAVAVHKWVIPCNWKFNAEQPSSDMYHAEVSHASAVMVMAKTDAERRAAELGIDADDPALRERLSRGGEFRRKAGAQFSSSMGHGTGWIAMPYGEFEERQGAGAYYDWAMEKRDEVVERFNDDARMENARGHANIFPNFMFLSNGTMRVTHPRGTNEMEIWAWVFVPAAAPDEVKDQIRLRVSRTFSAAGMFEQDDAENWLEEQRIMRGYMARQDPLNMQMRLGEYRYDVDGLPGKTAPHAYADEGLRGLYQHYLDMMSGASWSDLLQTKKEREEAERADAATRSAR